MRYDFEVERSAIGVANHTIAYQLRMIGTRKRVLELGCATGRVTKVLSQDMGCRVTAVESDPEAAERARPFCDRLVVGDLTSPETLADVAGHYDVILAGDVLEHLAQPEWILIALSDSLATNGCWVISVPNVAHWSIRKELALGRFTYTETGNMDRTHLRWFTRESMTTMLWSAGYVVTEVEAVTTLPLQDQLGLQKLAARLARSKVAQGLLGFQLVFRAERRVASPMPNG